MNQSNHELIMCVVNTGFSETVMEAAKDAGARGGTILSGRGTANKQAESFFHIAIQPEKEVVMILVDKKIKDAVLHALYQKAGLDTMGQGIAFTLPVDDVVGLTPWKAVDKDGKTIKMPSLKSLEKSAEQAAETK